ncbi:PREDICTED: odorant receptor 82a-like [Wasmannia auropunctata]|uniref:odorant receptor 82a-like n=1 Tax=Wasmannia auropunctata TaxID=64793 RepID=UPI0005EE924E|nr:PREDICTED: odorant receptor 82a-like [Wasmannia auropunctata]
MSDSKRILTNFQNINDYSIQLNRWFLISIGAWPQVSAPSRVKKIIVSMQIFIFSTVVAVIMLPCLLYVFFEKVDIKMKLGAVVPLMHRVMGSINYWVLLARNKDIQYCIRHMETDWQRVQKLDDREVMLRYAKIGRSITGFCAIFMHSGTLLFSVVKAIKTTTFTVGNQTFTMYPMTCPAYSKIIDVRFSPTNEILLSVQLMSTLIVSSSTVAICGLAAVFAMHACGQLNVLHSWLNELTEEKKNHVIERKLATIVQHHWRVLSFVVQIESIMHKACLGELMGCTMCMCLLGYYSVLNWGAFDAVKIFSYMGGIITMSFNIFIFCYIGEVLTEQCKNVGEVAYMTNWYKLPRKTALGFVLIIMQSSYIIKITAGKIFRLSIATFGDVIKTSLAYLNFLRTMTA